MMIKNKTLDWLVSAVLAASVVVCFASPVDAETKFTPVRTQFLAALGDSGANSGTGAENWGLWRKDPGPRGVDLHDYEQLVADGVAPAQWRFNSADWWLEEHGLIMETPEFSLAPGKYLVTGDRAVQTTLTVFPKDASGSLRWELGDGATLYDVTHLRCRSARYTPAPGGKMCSPAAVQQSAFPVTPGAAMPVVSGCSKQDYAVLFIVGVES
jgi:hypothetical protein